MDFSDHKVIQKSFGWIKKNLDPSKSYIIFENNLNRQSSSIFSESLIAYQYLQRGGCSWKKVYDPDCLKEYLVIEIAQGEEEQTLGKVMGYGFPEDTIYYLYRAEEQ